MTFPSLELGKNTVNHFILVVLETLLLGCTLQHPLPGAALSYKPEVPRILISIKIPDEHLVDAMGTVHRLKVGLRILVSNQREYHGERSHPDQSLS